MYNKAELEIFLYVVSFIHKVHFNVYCLQKENKLRQMNKHEIIK